MLEEILRERKKKLDTYEAGAPAFPHDPALRLTLRETLDGFEEGKECLISGRIFSLRDQGKIVFVDIKDESGKFQAVFREDETENFPLFAASFDMGDFIEATGTYFTTARGEKSILAKRFRMLAKAMRPLPDSWYGIEDSELKLRKRYLDFLMNENERDLMRKKAIFWGTVRSYLAKEKFLEVETPVLEAVPGGAEAEPFVTHHNALGEDFYLRISLELPLKKMLVGGFDRVFEIGRVFRNEGIDREHLQDYTTMECYAAYQDYGWMMGKMQEMYREVVRAVTGGLTTTHEGRPLDWGAEWPLVDYYEALKKEAGVDLHDASIDDLRKKAESLGIVPEPFAREGRLIDLIFKKTVRPKLVSPCFLVNPPVSIEPLAKRTAEDPKRVYRFQIMAAGTELGKGFSELNDPRDQRNRFEEQMRLREGGDKEAQMIDEEFIEALEYGMPPAAGFGVSERLFAVLMDRSIRETVAFPLLRAEK
jgi:lysyl-tRNA synthetase class 2